MKIVPLFVSFCPVSNAGDEAQRVEEWTTGASFGFCSRFCLGGQPWCFGFLGRVFWWVVRVSWQATCYFFKTTLFLRSFNFGMFEKVRLKDPVFKMSWTPEQRRLRIFVVFFRTGTLERLKIHWVSKIRSPIRLAQGIIFMIEHTWGSKRYTDTPIYRTLEPDVQMKLKGWWLRCFKPRPCWPSVVPLHRYRAGGVKRCATYIK